MFNGKSQRICNEKSKDISVMISPVSDTLKENPKGYKKFLHLIM